jgi:hypothetical protein
MASGETRLHVNVSQAHAHPLPRGNAGDDDVFCSCRNKNIYVQHGR